MPARAEPDRARPRLLATVQGPPISDQVGKRGVGAAAAAAATVDLGALVGRDRTNGPGWPSPPSPPCPSPHPQAAENAVPTGRC
jgi:hypothetical protein